MFKPLDKSLHWSAKWYTIVEDPFFVGTFRVDDVSVRELPIAAVDTTFWTPPRAVKKSRMPAILFEPDEAHMLGDDEGDADLDDECEEVPEDDSDNDELQDTWQISLIDS